MGISFFHQYRKKQQPERFSNKKKTYICNNHIQQLLNLSNMEQTELKEIVSKFAIKGTVSEIKPLGAGLINDTFKVNTAEDDQPNYVLQRINNAIDPAGLSFVVECFSEKHATVG